MIKRYSEFISELECLSKYVVDNGEVEFNEQRFSESFFKQASHTPDNIECMKYIEYGATSITTSNSRKSFGLKIKDKDISVCDIANSLESEEIVDCLKEEFQELTSEEIYAALRVITVTILGFQCREIGINKKN